jgi:hypothetical protein
MAWLLLLLVASAPVRAAEDPSADACAGSSADCAGTAGEEPNWADSSYEFVTGQGDSLAQWVDSFFGTPDSDAESADSVLRLLGEYEWDQEEGGDQKLRLRGKVDLPQLGKRLSLVLSEEDEERSDVVPDQRRQDGDVGLQYRVAERARSRLYLSVGTNASLEFRSSLRYRYEQPLGERWRFRFSDRVYFKEGDGFGNLARGDLDYAIDARQGLRWTTDLDYGEETDGAEWGTRLSHYVRLNEKEAFSTFAAASGQTDPETYTGAYSLGVRYRRSVFRPWMFVELEPSHVWRKDEPWENRSSAWVMVCRIEFREELGNRRAGPLRQAVQGATP